MSWSALVSHAKNQSEFDAALKFSVQWSENEPDNAEAWTSLSLVWLLVGQPKEALLAIQKAIELNPHHIGHHYEHAIIQHRNFAFEDSLESFRQCITLSQAQNEDLFLESAKAGAAKCLLDLYQPNEAIACLNSINEEATIFLPLPLTAKEIKVQALHMMV